MHTHAGEAVPAIRDEVRRVRHGVETDVDGVSVAGDEALESGTALGCEEAIRGVILAALNFPVIGTENELLLVVSRLERAG